MIYTTQRRRFVYDTWDNGSWLDRVIVECTLSITHCLRLNLQLRTIDLVRTCRINSFCTVAWHLARFQLARRIARSLGDSWASCTFLLPAHPGSHGQRAVKWVHACMLSGAWNILMHLCVCGCVSVCLWNYTSNLHQIFSCCPRRCLSSGSIVTRIYVLQLYSWCHICQ